LDHDNIIILNYVKSNNQYPVIFDCATSVESFFPVAGINSGSRKPSHSLLPILAFTLRLSTMKLYQYKHVMLTAIVLSKATGTATAWTSSNRPVIPQRSIKSLPAKSSATTRTNFLNTLLIGTGGILLAKPMPATAEPPKKMPTYLKERGSLETGLGPCPGQPAKKCCWSTEDTQGRRCEDPVGVTKGL